MRLKPRHYLLIAVLIGLGIWNYVRREHARHDAAVTVFQGPSTPGWQAYDHAAALRDAPESQFTPALDALRSQADKDTDADGTDLRNCMMWLGYYRHSAALASGNTQNWAMLATSHVQTCTAEHRDLGR